MARIIAGAGVSALSGKAGGIIYSRNKAGAYIRPTVTVVVPNSTRQAQLKTNLTVVSQAWAGLTAGQRAAWNNYATHVSLPDRMGGRAYVSGAAMFNRTNMAVLEAGIATLISDAPTDPFIGEKDETLAVTASEATQNMSITFDNTKPWATEAGGKLIVYQGLPQAASHDFFAGPWKRAGVISGATPTAPTSPATIACSYAVTQGMKLWVQCRTLRADGRLSDPFRAECVVGS